MMREQIAGCAIHGPAPIPQEGQWTKALEITDLSGLTHGIALAPPNRAPAN